MGSMFLIVVDAFSKWIDAIIMGKITSAATIEQLQHVFSTHGLPKTIVTDNGPSFVSAEFERFCRVNGLRHSISAPYHPSTNGLAERAVQTVKQGPKRMQGGTLRSRLSRFLFRYRITPHSSTGLSPAELLMGRRPRSALDLTHPDTAQRVTDHQQKQSSEKTTSRSLRSFQVTDPVFVRDFRSSGVLWMPGEVVRVTGPLSYHVRVSIGIVRHHVDNV